MGEARDIKVGDTITAMGTSYKVTGHRLGRVEVIKVREVRPSITETWTDVFGEVLTKHGGQRKGRPLIRVTVTPTSYHHYYG